MKRTVVIALYVCAGVGFGVALFLGDPVVSPWAFWIAVGFGLSAAVLEWRQWRQ